MLFEHKRYVVVGTNDETAEAVKTLFAGTLGRYSAEVEIDELDHEEIELLLENSKDRLISRYSELY